MVLYAFLIDSKNNKNNKNEEEGGGRLKRLVMAVVLRVARHP
jgi:hypothetical protein